MKNRYDLEPPDLAPDLEWMLTSGQVSSAALLERLLQEYYPKIFQLAYLIFDDRLAAGEAVRQVFVEAMLAAHRYTDTMSVDIWLYRIAWTVCLKVASRRSSRPETPDSLRSGLLENACLWQAVEALAIDPQRLLGMHLLLGWSVDLISQVTGAPAPHVAEVLQSARRALYASCPHAASSDAALSQELARLFSQRWPAPAPDELDLSALAIEIGKATSARNRRVKPLATFLEVSLLAVLVLVAGIFLIQAGRAEKEAPPAAVARQSTATPSIAARSTGAPPSGYGYKPTIESPLMPRSSDFIPAPTSTPTPAGVLYSSQPGEGLAQIASQLGISADDFRRLNRIPADEQVAYGQFLYIPGSLSELNLRRTTPVPTPLSTLPLETPASPAEIAALMFPGDPTYYTVWIDALLFMHPQLPFSDVQDVLRIQLWLSDDQALLIGGPLSEEPREVLLQDRDEIFIARPGEANPWFQPADSLGGPPDLDLRLLYGATALLRRPSTYGYEKYQLSGEETIAGRPAWKVAVLDDQMAPEVEISIDKETGFILKYARQDRYPRDRETRSFSPLDVVIASIEYNVDFPQDLFNPRLPWRGGYAQDHTGQLAPVVDQP